MISSAREPIASTLRRPGGANLAWGMSSKETLSTFSEKRPDIAAVSDRLPAAPSKSRGSSKASMPSVSRLKMIESAVERMAKALLAVS